MAQAAADQITIVDVTDAYSVILTSESTTFPGTTNTAKAGSVTTQIIAMMGAEQVPASVTLSEVTAPSGVTVTKDTNATSPTLTIAVSTAVTTNGVVTIPVHIGDVTITKKFSFSIAFTGAAGGNGTAGVSATSVIVGNEAQTISATAAGNADVAQTITIPFAAYIGTTRAAATVTVGTLPAGVTVTTNTAATASADGSLVLAIASGATFGNSATRSGIIDLTFTANGQTFPRKFSWSKAVAGANGSNGSNGTNGTNGANGADAILLAVTSSNGLIFKNAAIATTLTARVFKGGVEVTGTALTALGTIKWYKDGGTTAVGTGPSLVIDAGQVTSKATYTAALEN